jgi:hypothetical protein
MPTWSSWWSTYPPEPTIDRVSLSVNLHQPRRSHHRHVPRQHGQHGLPRRQRRIQVFMHTPDVTAALLEAHLARTRTHARTHTHTTNAAQTAQSQPLTTTTTANCWCCW